MDKPRMGKMDTDLDYEYVLKPSSSIRVTPLRTPDISVVSNFLQSIF